MSEKNENKALKSQEELLKEKKGADRKKVLKTIGAVIIVGIVVAIGISLYSSIYYFKTDNASISADSVTITPLMTGNVLQWNVKEGDEVKAGDVLGKQDLASISSSTINTTQLTSSPVSKADIKTPIDGKVVQSNVIVGETLAPGMQAAVVADVNNIYVKANVEETSIFKIKQGQLVEITIDAYPNKKFTGYVKDVGQATQSAFSLVASINTSGTYTKVTQLVPIKISLVNEEKLPMLMGMNATVNIKIK